MRLGKKKDKERDLEKEQCVEGVARLICSPKQSHPVPLRGKCCPLLMRFIMLIMIFVAHSLH